MSSVPSSPLHPLQKKGSFYLLAGADGGRRRARRAHCGAALRRRRLLTVQSVQHGGRLKVPEKQGGDPRDQTFVKSRNSRDSHSELRLLCAVVSRIIGLLSLVSQLVT